MGGDISFPILGILGFPLTRYMTPPVPMIGSSRWSPYSMPPGSGCTKASRRAAAVRRRDIPRGARDSHHHLVEPGQIGVEINTRLHVKSFGYFFSRSSPITLSVSFQASPLMRMMSSFHTLPNASIASSSLKRTPAGRNGSTSPVRLRDGDRTGPCPACTGEARAASSRTVPLARMKRSRFVLDTRRLQVRMDTSSAPAHWCARVCCLNSSLLIAVSPRKAIRPRRARAPLLKVRTRDQASTSTRSLISSIHLAFFSCEEASSPTSGLAAASSGFKDFASRANGSSAFAGRACRTSSSR